MYDAVGRLQLEAKADIKKRIGHSTDLGDAIALSFAVKNVELLCGAHRMRQCDFVDDGVYF